MQDLYLGGYRPSPGFSLYTHLFRSALFPFGNSVKSYVWFSWRKSISSYRCPFLLPRSSLAPSHQLTIRVPHPEIYGGLFSLLEGICILGYWLPVLCFPPQPTPHPNPIRVPARIRFPVLFRLSQLLVWVQPVYFVLWLASGFRSIGFLLHLVVSSLSVGRMFLTSPSPNRE